HSTRRAGTVASALLVPEIPFARHGREVPGLPQHFGDGHAPVVETAGRARGTFADDVVEVPHPGLVRIEPGQQAGARRRAARCDVELGEAHTPGCQRVEVRCRYLAPI